MKLTVIVPCYNEEKNIPLILKRFEEVINRDDVGVLLVDNGSTDESESVIKDLLPKYPFAQSFKVPVNQGYGYGIYSGLQQADAEYIGWTHADMQTDPNDVIRALELIEKNGNEKNLFVKGDRKKRPIFDAFFTVGMGLFESLLLRTWLWDINAQPNIFHRTFLSQWDNVPKDFSLDLYVLYLAKVKNLHIIRFPVVFSDREHGESHWNTSFYAKWKFIKRTLAFSFQLKKEL